MPNDVRCGSQGWRGRPQLAPTHVSHPTATLQGPAPTTLHRGGSASATRAQEQEGLLGQKRLEEKGKLRHRRGKGLGQHRARALGCGSPVIPARGGLSETKKQGLPKESSALPSWCLPQFPQSYQA